MEGDIEGEVCDCGCGLNFIPDTPGFRLGLLDYERQLLYSFKEWEISNDTWANFIHDPWVFGKNDVIVQRWGEFQSLIIQSHFEKPTISAWTHLFNTFCSGDVEYEKNTIVEFEYIN